MLWQVCDLLQGQNGWEQILGEQNCRDCSKQLRQSSDEAYLYTSHHSSSFFPNFFKNKEAAICLIDFSYLTF